MDDAVALALDAEFPERTVERTGPAGPSWNENNRTVLVEFADGGVVYLKVATDGDPSRIARERAAIEYVAAHCEVPVPDVLGSDVDGSTPYLATAPLSGRAVGDHWEEWTTDERTETARLAGETLAALHGVGFDRPGRITGGGADGLDVRAEAWPDQLLGSVEYIRELAPSDRFDHHFEAAHEAVEANHDRLTGVPSVLVHGDVTRGNCFRRADGVALLDWEDAYAGDPVREIRRTQRQLLDPVGREPDERTVTAFHDGYRDRAGGLPDGFDERAPIYAVVSFLDTSGFFDTWAPEADEPTDEIADWVEAEMDRRLAAV
ncbi:phosphotransferase family protein [Halosimplex salinum]|uniref:phosphotransferase family protein n=1 Tax=Halosimplex salinum TaxID=1710538 RepID=UPI000F482413|nr:aminoglycoside phosphotransferase family protein [Halosimplex salinum]